MPVQSFNTAETYMNNLIHTYHQTANSKDEIIKQLAKILDNLNYFHPFREGNGRTQREVIRSLALSKGYSAQIRVEQDDDIYNLYMDGTVYGDLEKLEELFDRILDNYRGKIRFQYESIQKKNADFKRFFFLQNAVYCTVFQFKLYLLLYLFS